MYLSVSCWGGNIMGKPGNFHGPLAKYVKLWVAHAPGMPGTFSPPRVSDPDMHHGMCVTHVPWYIPGSLTSSFRWSRWRGNVPGITVACATHNFAYLVRGPWLPLMERLFASSVMIWLREMGRFLSSTTRKSFRTCTISGLRNDRKIQM